MFAIIDYFTFKMDGESLPHHTYCFCSQIIFYKESFRPSYLYYCIALKNALSNGIVLEL